MDGYCEGRGIWLFCCLGGGLEEGLEGGLKATARFRTSKMQGIATISYNYNENYNSSDSNILLVLFYTHLYTCIGQWDGTYAWRILEGSGGGLELE